MSSRIPSTSAGFQPAFPACVTLIALVGILALAGCPARRAEVAATPAAATPAPALHAPVEAADLARRLAARCETPLKTLRVGAKAVVEAESVEGRKVFHATVVAELPAQLRFRASREPIGELFQLLQSGDTLSIYLPRDRQLFEGPIDSLTESAGLIRRLHPLWMLRGLAAYEHLAHLAPDLAWRRLDASTIEGVGPSGFAEVPWARFVVNEPTMDILRVYLYGRPPAGTMSSESSPSSESISSTESTDDETADGGVEVAIVYGAWSAVGGVTLPDSLTISIPRENTRIALTAPDYLVNPPLAPATFTIQPVPGTERYHLSQLVFVDESDADNADE